MHMHNGPITKGTPRRSKLANCPKRSQEHPKATQSEPLDSSKCSPKHANLILRDPQKDNWNELLVHHPMLNLLAKTCLRLAFAATMRAVEMLRCKELQTCAVLRPTRYPLLRADAQGALGPHCCEARRATL